MIGDLAWFIEYFNLQIIIIVVLFNWSLQLQMSTQDSFWVCQKNHYRWFFLRLLIRTWGILYNLALGYIMLGWMTRTDLWLKNFLQTTRFRQLLSKPNHFLIHRNISFPYKAHAISGIGLHKYISMGSKSSSSFGYY